MAQCKIAADCMSVMMSKMMLNKHDQTEVNNNNNLNEKERKMKALGMLKKNAKIMVQLIDDDKRFLEEVIKVKDFEHARKKMKKDGKKVQLSSELLASEQLI